MLYTVHFDPEFCVGLPQVSDVSLQLARMLLHVKKPVKTHVIEKERKREKASERHSYDQKHALERQLLRTQRLTAAIPFRHEIPHRAGYIFTRITSRPGYTAPDPSSSSIRRSRLYLHTRSVLDREPVLIKPVFSATAISAIVVSSVSPDR